MKMVADLSFEIARDLDMPEITDILVSNNLCVDDIPSQNILIKLVKTDNQIVAVYAFEIFDHVGILRSVAVIDEYKGSGIGTHIMKQVETDVIELKLKKLILLTTTAEKFFEKFGFDIIPRDSVPEVVKQSFEFLNSFGIK